MKNLLESFAVLLVSILSLLIIFLIVQYNMIKEDIIDDIAYTPVKTKKKETTKDYLSDMEKYADVDVKVDPTKDDNTNSVDVKSELTKNTIDETVEDKSKSSYMKNLNEYTEKKVETPQKVETPIVEDESGEEAAKKIIDGMGDKNQMKAIEDMGNALDSIVGDEEEKKVASSNPKPMETVDDEIGMAIDEALNDI